MSLEIVQIIENDPAQARLLDQVLRGASFRTNVAQDGPSGMQDVWRLKPALVMLDDNLPGMTGHEVCRRLRRDPVTRHIPIIMLSGFVSEDRRVSGLDSGADDYICKPYGANELVARARAVLRRYRQSMTETMEGQDEELALEHTVFVARYRGKRLMLALREWKALCRLASSPGAVVPREELCSLLWGDDGLFHETELARCLEQLSLKLTEEVSVGSLQIVPGGGVRIVLPPAPAASADRP
jgi:DNA-binding response OmpR family regulator